MTQTSFRDAKNLSALLDQQLNPAESARLQKRLQTEAELRDVYEDLRQTRSALRRLPQRRAPRNFVLKPSAARVRPPLPRSFSAFRWASALASLLLFFSFAANAALPRLASLPANAPLSGLGMGGSDTQAAVEAEPNAGFESAPAAEEPSLKIVQATAAPQAAEPALEAPAVMPPAEQAPPMSDERGLPTLPPPGRAPLPPWTLIVLGGVAISSASAAFLLRWQTDRRWKNINIK
ncbi:MAG: hypothetical protein RBS68_12435 [Anaerolineales bacterium]|jgi:hypothetical protein|nr:hypothetical protein [Anaerolineales bacterium]